MARLTKYQVLGTKFEIWLEHLFKNLGYEQVFRNVEYRLSRNCFRQVDLLVFETNGYKIKKTLVEAKYSSNGPIKYFLRQKKKKSAQQLPRIDNLVDELLERKSFTGADKALLVTNKHFDGLILKESKKKNVGIIQGHNLEEAYRRSGGKLSLEESISKINLGNYRLYKNILYV